MMEKNLLTVSVDRFFLLMEKRTIHSFNQMNIVIKKLIFGYD